MTTWGFHASHEQFTPSRLLQLVEDAEEAGFGAVLSSDHLAPFSLDQGEAGFAWSWLGAAMARTRLPFGVVTAPGQRYHPVVTAQAIATLAEMFPGRFLPALGSGQAVNEHVTGDPWPDKDTRNARLRECHDVVTTLLRGEVVNRAGLLRVDEARLHTLPDVVPPVLAAAVTPATAAEVAPWADGLITVGCAVDSVREVLSAFRDAGGAGKPVHLQVHLSWAEDAQAAGALAEEHWRASALAPGLLEDLRTPEDIDRATRSVTAAGLADSVLMAHDPGETVERLLALAELGVDRVLLHHVGTDQEGFVRHAGEDLLPRLSSP